MNYGVPYKGSKNKIAGWVVSNLPKADNFYDLFAGGCAVTHCALLSGKYKSCYANDLWTAPRLFLDAANGKYRNEKRWISREQFFAERLTDPYIQFCWSFGSNGKDYIYSKEIKESKRALHNLVFFNEYKDFDKITGIDFKYSKDEMRKSVYERYMIYKKFRREKLASKKEFVQLQSLESLERLQSLERLESLERLQSLENLGRLQSPERLERLERLQVTQGDYRNVRIKPDSVIYCDIPYRNTDDYNFKPGKKSGTNDFDYEAFYKWCGKQKELVVVSEYAMPEDFVCVGSREKTVHLSTVSTGKAVERLFVPRHQVELYKEMMSLLF